MELLYVDLFVKEKFIFCESLEKLNKFENNFQNKTKQKKEPPGYNF